MKCWETDCEAERVDGKPYCKDHKRKKQLNTFKEIGIGTAGILFGITIFILVVSVIIIGIVDAVNDPNINTKTLDNLCIKEYGNQSKFYKEDIPNNNIICVNPIIDSDTVSKAREE